MGLLTCSRTVFYVNIHYLGVVVLGLGTLLVEIDLEGLGKTISSSDGTLVMVGKNTDLILLIVFFL